jgi:predicted amidohydrolase YtcJ
MKIQERIIWFFLVSILIVPLGVFAEPADYVFTGGKVYTVNEAQPWAEAVAVQRKKITFVGSDADAKKYVGDATQVIALSGKMLLPGFVEGHFHPLTGALLTVGVDLQYDSVERVLDSVKEFADANPDEKVIRGFGWRYSSFPSTGPTKELLDEIVPDRPVFLFAVDGHGAWVNSKALEMAGITRDTPDPQPGYSHFQRGPDGKELTGYLVEVPAELLVLNALQPQTSASIGSAFKKLLPDFPAAGVTAVFDAGIQGIPAEDGFSLYMDLEKNDELPIRIVGSYYHNDPAIDPLPIIQSYRKEFQSELVQAEVLKINVDGGDAQYTAAMLQPYASRPEITGEPIFTPKELNDLIQRADAEGIDVHLHAFGDRAVRMSLDGIEAASAANKTRDRRHTIAHAIYIQEDDLSRFAELDVITSMSIQWATPDLANLQLAVTNLGEPIVYERFMRARSLLDSGAKLSLGTDWPAAGYYSTYKPLEAIQVAVTREVLKGSGLKPVMPPTDETLTLEQAIKANTLTSAYQIRLDEKLGSIEVGKAADLVVLQKNLFDVAPKEISDVDVLLTMMNGNVTYREKGF